jgi:hypothetical protein
MLAQFETTFPLSPAGEGLRYVSIYRGAGNAARRPDGARLLPDATIY